MNLYDKKHAWILGGFEFLHADTTVEANPGSGGATFAADAAAGGELHPYTKMEFGASGTQTPVSTSNPLPVVQTGTLTLPTGAATAAKQPALGTAGSASADVITVQGVASMTAVQIADNGGSITVDASSLPLPTGASTAAKQPALGTAGSASADVITVQGVASMTPIQIADNGGSVTVDGTVTAAGGAAHDAAVSGNPNLIAGYASAAAPSDVSGDGDAVRAWYLRNGAAATVLTAAGALVGGDASNGLDVDVTRVGGTVTVGGVAAHDAAVSGNPVRVAARAGSADYTAVANGDTADLYTDLSGKLVVAPYSIPENMEYGVTAAITSTSATEVLAAAASGISHYITQLTVTNSHATVGTVVEIRDGTSTVLHRGYAAPAGGGYTATFPVPLKGTAATAVNAYNITNSSNTYVSLSGYKGRG